MSETKEEEFECHFWIEDSIGSSGVGKGAHCTQDQIDRIKTIMNEGK